MDKDEKTFKKLKPFTQEMILFASEPLEAEDDTGTPLPVTCTPPVESCARLLHLGNVAQAKLHLDNVIIVNKHKCPVSLSLAIITAIVNGCLTWSDHSNTEAFSIFAYFKPGPLAIGADSDDFLALQLKSSEDQGLSDSDVACSTMVLLYIPHDKQQLEEFIGAFAIVLSIIFGPNSTVCQVIRGWGSHIHDHEILYSQQMRAD